MKNNDRYGPMTCAVGDRVRLSPLAARLANDQHIGVVEKTALKYVYLKMESSGDRYRLNKKHLTVLGSEEGTPT